MLAKLREKRSALVAKQQQLMANVNVTSGAIAMCDEVIEDLVAIDLAAKAAEAAAAAQTPPKPPRSRSRRAA